MRIDVIGTSLELTGQARAYTEYQVFLRMAPLANDVESILVVVSPGDDARDTICHASARLRGSGQIRVSTRHNEPTGAIDAMASKLSAAVCRHLRLAAAQ